MSIIFRYGLSENHRGRTAPVPMGCRVTMINPRYVPEYYCCVVYVAVYGFARYRGLLVAVPVVRSCLRPLADGTPRIWGVYMVRLRGEVNKSRWRGGVYTTRYRGLLVAVPVVRSYLRPLAQGTHSFLHSCILIFFTYLLGNIIYICQ